MSSKQVLMETLAALFTDSDQGKTALATIEEAVDGMLTELKVEHEAEISDINEQILEQYQVAANMIRETEEKAYAGYADAAKMLEEREAELQSLKAKIDEVKAELETEAYDNYEEAAKMIDELRRKNDTLELDMQEAYDERLKTMREDLVDRLDAFLSTKSEQVYEHILDEVKSNPAIAVEANALRKIRQIVGEAMVDDDAPQVEENKEQPVVAPAAVEAGEDVNHLQSEVTELRTALRHAQAKNTRLSVENTRLVREAREAKEKVLNEIAAADKTARQALSEDSQVETPAEVEIIDETETVVGKGKIVSLDEIVKEDPAPIAEASDGDATNSEQGEINENVMISPGLSIKDFRILAGIKSE